MTDIATAAATWRAAKADADTAREQLRAAVLAAIDAGMSQREAAKQASMDRPTVHRWVHER